MEEKEKRRFVRLSSNVKIIYGQMAKMQNPDLALSQDISAGGIRIPLEKKATRGELLEIEINLPDKKAPIFALGRVVWAKKVGSGYEAGVKLTSIDHADRLRLFKFIAP
jgi:Tfp pilus assembly protein PilZ